MKRNLIIGLASLFSILFLFYVFQLASEISGAEKKINTSSDVVDATELVRSEYIITEEADAPSSGWKEIKLPGSIQADPDYKSGRFAHYRIQIPASIQEKLPSLKGQLSASLGLVHYSSYDIFVNGKFLRSNTPSSSIEQMTIVPIEDGVDNTISIKAKIGYGDAGMEHRLRILVGKTAKLNETYLLIYKGAVVFPQIFILSKGSVLFLFTLIFIVISLSPFFEKFLIFGFFTLSSDFITGDALVGILDLNTMAILFSILNAGAVIALFLFLCDATRAKFTPAKVKLGVGIFLLFSTFVTVDVLYTHFAVDFTKFLNFWNIVPALILAAMLPRAIRSSRVLALGMLISLSMTFISSVFTYSVLFNYRVFGDLILFFAVAAETFFLLRKEQDQLREQEKDVAIGRTAAILAHDVRRPLEQMKMVLERISSGKSSPEFLEAAKRDVEFSLTSVNTQVNDIMNFSSVRTLELVPVSFNRLFMSGLTQVMTINQNVDLKLTYDFQAKNKVLADESLLAGVLTNLISNAVEAIRDIGKRKSGTIHFTTRQEGQKFIFSITNDGPEIPEDVLGEIWKPLFTRGKSKGTGLGLASVARAVHDHQGSVSAANTPEGVRFTIVLNSASENDSSALAIRNLSKDFSYKAEVQASGKKLRVFILDDDSQVFDYFRYLSDVVEYTFVATYADAEKEVSAKRFDLYIIDYDLGTARTGADFIEQYLPLKKNVILHSNRESTQAIGNSKQVPKPLSSETFSSFLSDIQASAEKILLVDDSELVREAWTLYHGEHNLTALSSPEDALELLGREKFSSFVLDYYFDNSPMNGLELAKRVKAMNSGSFIVLSSNVKVPSDEFQVITKTSFSAAQRSILGSE